MVQRRTQFYLSFFYQKKCITIAFLKINQYPISNNKYLLAIRNLTGSFDDDAKDDSISSFILFWQLSITLRSLLDLRFAKAIAKVIALTSLKRTCASIFVHDITISDELTISFTRLRAMLLTLIFTNLTAHEWVVWVVEYTTRLVFLGKHALGQMIN